LSGKPGHLFERLKNPAVLGIQIIISIRSRLLSALTSWFFTQAGGP